MTPTRGERTAFPLVTSLGRRGRLGPRCEVEGLEVNVSV